MKARARPFTRLLVLSCLGLGLISPLQAASSVAQSGNEVKAESIPIEAAQVRLAVDRLQQWYDPASGRWRTAGWWNDANSLTVLIDYSRATHTTAYEPVIANTFALNSGKGFLNDFYDDEGWWALAWIDAYDLTGSLEYLDAARHIFADMAGGWDQTCGGGLWWTKKRNYKNAIANELFLSVAARLANRSSDAKLKAVYAGWARREWRWFQHSGMIEKDHLISDGLDGECHNNHRTKWTYNQGVVLGGLVELSRQKGQGGDWRAASRIAGAAIAKLTRDGILHEPCEPNCGEDGTQFKGIFVRNLAQLNVRQPARPYAAFLRANAASILERDQAADHAFGLVWSGPPGVADAVSQTSALDALVATLGLERHRRN